MRLWEIFPCVMFFSINYKQDNNMALLNPFELFNLSSSFQLDLIQLQQAYLKAQTQYHPDRLINASAQDKLEAHIKSAAINDAYNILKNPIKRAQACLQLLSIPIPGAVQHTVSDPELFMHIMEVREEIENADLQKRNALVTRLQEEFEAVMKEFSKLFNALQADSSQGQSLNRDSEIQKIYLKLLYFHKILNDFQ